MQSGANLARFAVRCQIDGIMRQRQGGEMGTHHRKQHRPPIAVAGLLGFLACGSPTWAGPPFGDTAGTVFDIITGGDPRAFLCLQPMGQQPRQIWDKRGDGEPLIDAHLFIARDSDGVAIEIAINPAFLAVEAAALAKRFAWPLGQLPGSLRAGITRFSVHGGDEGFHAGDGQIVVYTARTDQRASYLHPEEPLVHEADHAAWDIVHSEALGWIASQKADGGFLTGYAAANPTSEDLAETALFAFAILHHPDRFPPVDTADTQKAVPHRIACIAQRLPPDELLIVPVDVTQTCELGS